MTTIGHVSALPVEELVLPLAYGGGALWLAVRTWLLAHRNRKPK
jgi:hypothetical protein